MTLPPDEITPDPRRDPADLSRRRMMQLGAAGAAVLAAGCTIPGSGRAATQAAEEWAAENIPDQTARRVIVTGGNGYPRDDRSGLGYHDALELARKGAEVTIASRDAIKGAEAVRRIQAEVPGARIRFERLDLTDLTQVKAFAARRRASGEGLDILINNAGVMGRRNREITHDGHERVMGTNVIGPYVLTAALMPLLRQGQSPRVVWVSSSRVGAMDLDDLQYQRDYHYGQAYNRSKLGVLFLALEMDRRSRAGGWGVSSLACHPGVARTFLVPDGPGMDSPEGLRQRAGLGLFPPASRGALSTLYAATLPQASGGRYYGPQRGLSGSPAEVDLPELASDTQSAARLWTTLEGIGQTAFA